MFGDTTVIDVHGHISSPPQVRAFAYNLIALRNRSDNFTLSDDAVKPAMDRHLRMLDERGIDVQLLSPRPVAMMHWERPFIVRMWTRATNDLIAQQCRLQPGRFAGIAQLPQNVDRDTSNCVEELERCVTELGFVGALVNPDPGGDRRAPGMDADYWYPLYAKAQELDATLIVHPASSRDPRLESIARQYQYNNLTEETLATLLLEQSDVFERFPRLRIVICHCGGASRRLLDLGDPLDAVRQGRGIDTTIRRSGEHSGGQVGIEIDWNYGGKRDITQNLFFDTCAYDPYFLATAIRQRGVDRMVFGTEVPGAGSAMVNPDTGKPADDLLAVLDGFDFLTDEERLRIVNANPLRVFPLLAGRGIGAAPLEARS
jgi:predicted TIM-barrel fold metal-dependent hydrolase